MGTAVLVPLQDGSGIHQHSCTQRKSESSLWSPRVGRVQFLANKRLWSRGVSEEREQKRSRRRTCRTAIQADRSIRCHIGLYVRLKANRFTTKLRTRVICTAEPSDGRRVPAAAGVHQLFLGILRDELRFWSGYAAFNHRMDRSAAY